MVCDEFLGVEDGSRLGLPGHLVLLTLASFALTKVSLNAILDAVNGLRKILDLCLESEVVLQFSLKGSDADGIVNAVGIKC